MNKEKSESIADIRNEITFIDVRGDAILADLCLHYGMSPDESESAFVGVMYSGGFYSEPRICGEKARGGADE